MMESENMEDLLDKTEDKSKCLKMVYITSCFILSYGMFFSLGLYCGINYNDCDTICSGSNI